MKSIAPTPIDIYLNNRKNRLSTIRSIYELIDNSVEAIGNKEDEEGSVYINIEYKKDKASKIIIADNGPSIKKDDINDMFKYWNSDSSKKKNVENNIGFNGIGSKDAINSLGKNTYVVLKFDKNKAPCIFRHNPNTDDWDKVLNEVLPGTKKFKELESTFNNIVKNSTGTMFCIEDIDDGFDKEIEKKLLGEIDFWGSLVVRYTKRLEDLQVPIDFFVNGKKVSLKHPINDSGFKKLNENSFFYKQDDKEGKTYKAKATTVIYKCNQESYTQGVADGVFIMKDGVRQKTGLMVFVSGVLIDHCWRPYKAASTGIIKPENQRYNHYYPVVEFDNLGNMSLPINNNKELKPNGSFKNKKLSAGIQDFFKSEWREIVKETNTPISRQSSETNDILKRFQKKHILNTGSSRRAGNGPSQKKANTSKKDPQLSLPFDKSDGTGSRPKPVFVVEPTLKGDRAAQYEEEDNKIILRINVTTPAAKKRFGIDEENLNPVYTEQNLLDAYNLAQLDFVRGSHDPVYHKVILEGKVPNLSDEEIEENNKILETAKKFTPVIVQPKKVKATRRINKKRNYAQLLNSLLEAGALEHNHPYPCRAIAISLFDNNKEHFVGKKGGLNQIAAEIRSQFGKGLFEGKLISNSEYHTIDGSRVVTFKKKAANPSK